MFAHIVPVQNSATDTKQGVANIRIFKYIRIFSDTNIRSYHIRIIFLYEYIQIFVRIVFLFEYIQEKNLTFAPAGPKINVQRKITSILLCQLCFNFLLYHTSKIQHLASNLKLISKI